jgi:hypothetical protein
MRLVEYLSPSSIGVFDTDPEEFYMRYLADDRPPRMPQSQPMAIGSAFDAYVKAALHSALFGPGSDPAYELEALLEKQVEPQHLVWARQHGKYVMEQYRQAGCLGNLLGDLRKAQGDPRFEFEIRGEVNALVDGAIHGVTLLGKPDVHYVNESGCTVILDFKVNGYCSPRPQSPMAGYVNLRSAGRTNQGQHRDAQLMMLHGMMININKYLEDCDRTWARQVSVYGWLSGCAVGSEFLAAIDQVSCSPTAGGLPSIRFAEHRTRVGPKFQHEVFRRAAEIWEIVHSDWLFRDRTREASAEHAAMLDRRSRDLRGESAPHDVWFSQSTRQPAPWTG